MRCPECGYDVPEPLSLCPRCGTNVEKTQPMKRRWGRKRRPAPPLDETLPLPIAEVQEEAKEPPSAAPRLTLWQRVRVVLIALLAFLCLMVASTAVGGYTGLRQGQEDRAATLSATTDEHYRAGLAHLDAGEFELAIAEFDYVLRINPNHPLAAQGLAEARARLAAMPTPTSQAREGIIRELYGRGRTAYEAQNWEEAIAALSQLRAFDPQYETDAVTDMLFESLRNQGLSLLSANRLEEGIFLLDQAQQIHPLDEAVLREVELARRYLTAVDYWGVDWSRCIELFEGLYALAPNYQDVFSRLFEAHVQYGDLWVERGEMCPAAEQYDEALAMRADAEVTTRRDEAAEVCAVATPTPIAPLTGTLSTTATVSVPGFMAGHLAFPAYNSQTGLYDIYALFADGRLVRMASGADQPCWQWGSDRLIYRNRLSPGISMVQPGGQPVLLRADAGAAWPTLSPDGSRYAYSARDASGVSQIYIAPTDGTAEPTVHAPGWAPVWGPSGLLAWAGCEPGGGICGIFVDNPDDSAPPTRLTASADDTGLHWAPGGGSLAYMSDQAGSWDLYLLGVNGGVQVITSDPTIEGLPAWSPDGSAVAFISYREERWGIYLLQLGTGNVQKMIDLGVTLSDWQDQRLSWSP